MIANINAAVRSSRKLLAGALRGYARRLAPGSRFPSENTLIAELKVARMTLRRAMDDLVAEGTLFRKWGCGTFVAQTDPDTIYFVLPMPGSRLGPLRHFAMADFYDHICLRCKELKVKLIPLVASMTNRRDELDLEVFQMLPAGAKLILPGYWYAGLFELLNDRKCKICFVSPEFSFKHLYSQHFSSWFCIEYDFASAVESAVNEFRLRGVHKIMLLDADLHCESPYQAAFRKVMGDKFQPELVIPGASGRYDLFCVTLTYMLRDEENYCIEGILCVNDSVGTKALEICRMMKREIPIINLYSTRESKTFDRFCYDDNIAAKLALKQLTAPVWQAGFERITPEFITKSF